MVHWVMSGVMSLETMKYPTIVSYIVVWRWEEKRGVFFFIFVCGGEHLFFVFYVKIARVVVTVFSFHRIFCCGNETIRRYFVNVILTRQTCGQRSDHTRAEAQLKIPRGILSFFLSLFLKTQANHQTKWKVNIRLTT